MTVDSRRNRLAGEGDEESSIDLLIAVRIRIIYGVVS